MRREFAIISILIFIIIILSLDDYVVKANVNPYSSYLFPNDHSIYIGIGDEPKVSHNVIEKSIFCSRFTLLECKRLKFHFFNAYGICLGEKYIKCLRGKEHPSSP